MARSATVNVGNRRIPRCKLVYAEAMLQALKGLQTDIAERKRDYALAGPVGAVGGGRPGGVVCNPTHAAVANMDEDRDLRQWEAEVRRMREGLSNCTKDERDVLQLLHVDRLYKPAGVAQHLHISERSVWRREREGLYQVALALGIVK